MKATILRWERKAILEQGAGMDIWVPSFFISFGFLFSYFVCVIFFLYWASHYRVLVVPLCGSLHREDML